MTVVVNYRGPELLRGVAKAFRIELFDHVTSINFTHQDSRTNPLAKSDIERLPHLRHVELRKSLDQDDRVSSIVTEIPSCRLASASESDEKIEIELAQVELFGCPN